MGQRLRHRSALSGFDRSIRRRRTEKVRKNLEALEPLAIVKMGVGKKILGVTERRVDREEGEHNSLLFLEHEIEPSEVGSRLQDIDSQLEPCIGELIQIQQEIEALKNKFRKVEEESSVVKLDNIYEKMITQEEEEERSKKEDDPRVNFRFAQIANERDIQHMVGGQAGRSYKLEGLEKRDTGGWKIRRGLNRAGIEAKAGQGWVLAKAAWGGQQAVSVAGCDMLRTFGLGEADLQPCIDRLSVGDEVIP